MGLENPILTVDKKAKVLSEYKRYVQGLKNDYYRMNPEELLLYPLLDSEVLNIKDELRNSVISSNVLEILSYLEGPVLSVGISDEGVQGPEELWIASINRLIYINGEIRYLSDLENRSFIFPNEIIYYGPRYQDGSPTVTVDRDLKIPLTFDYEFDPNISGHYGRLDIEK